MDRKLPGYITVKEAAAKLNMTRNNLYPWLREGILQPYRISERIVLIEEAELNRVKADFESEAVHRSYRKLFRLYRDRKAVMQEEQHS